MSVSIKYKGAEIASASTEVTKTIKTAGKYCEADILVENTPDGGDAPVINSLSVTANGTYTAPSGVDGYSPVTVNVPQGITPTGNINITDTNPTDVTNYATAQVVSENLKSENIKKDIDILGVVGSFEGGGGERTKPWRAPDVPDITQLPIDGNYGNEQWILVDTSRLKANSLYDYGTGFLDFGTVLNGEFTSVYKHTKQSAAWEKINIPEVSASFLVIHRCNNTNYFFYTGYDSERNLALPIEEIYIVAGACDLTYWNDADVITMGESATVEKIANCRVLDLSLVPTVTLPALAFDSLTNTIEIIKPANGYIIAVNNYPIRKMQSVISFDMSDSVVTATNMSYWFQNCYKMYSLNISSVDFSNVTNFGVSFSNCYSLTEIITDSVTKLWNADFSMSESKFLSNSALVNIANAMGTTPHTWSLHKTPKANLSTIMGNVADGVFTADASGSTTLLDFINNIKGWTIA